MDLYSEHILDHYQSPRNAGRLTSPSAQATEYNPVCGDAIHVDVDVKDDFLTDVAFVGSGCAISQAAMSLLTEQSRGKSIGVLETLKNEDVFTLLGVPISSGRAKCALLGFAALKAALGITHKNAV